MPCYGIALPLNISNLYTYKCEKELQRGCRVLVNFNNNQLTGFIWTTEDLPGDSKSYNIKDILEIIDDQPVLSPDLLSLAEWMSNYYQCSLGTTILAMLPTAIQIQIAQEIRLSEKYLQRREDSLLTTQEQKILKLIHDDKWTNIATLKEKLKTIPILKTLEELEDAGIIDIKRTYDSKIKKKYANFIVINDPIAESPDLTPKQENAWNRIKELVGIFSDKDANSVPLARLADDFSYSIIKALREKGLIKIESREVKDQPVRASSTRIETNFTLTDEQQAAYSRIKEQIESTRFMTFLLYGVTGSGKTEVYIRLIRDCLALNRNAMILVPEIALTPQMEERFYNAFGENIAILHSHRNDRERWEEWKRIKRGQCRIVLGARSALFAPLENIGIIVVDEEHESSYKQDKNPRYNARDLAVLRGKQNNAVVVLGSATPSLESWFNAANNRYQLLKLTHRPLSIPMPQVNIVDMKEEDGDSLLSDLLKEKILERLSNKEQVILFQNRRGYASYVICITCGKIHRCTKCDVSLIYHSNEHILMCHYCGYREKMFRKCPDCGSYVLEFGIAGTQQLEKQLQIMYPSARLLRMDTDTTSGKDSYNSMFKRMKEGTVDILFGTQMIAKGLDFANVTLVGVISADNSLNIPDFRSTERTFQLLTQVAGRSGRGERKGEVVIQTFNPQHYAILTAQKQDYESFVDLELETRKTLLYPPYVRNARLVFSHNNETYLQDQMNSVRPLISSLKKYYSKDSNSDSQTRFDVLGPVPTPIHKINNRYRYHIILKSDSVKHLQLAVQYLQKNIKISKSVKIDIDIDPSSLM
ncbi:MAG: primosomal protein N' [Candidatus Cloacimonetes bacterium]|nr:primosomal protein N' [Candidatus Cloacimonadota bacterium]